MFDLIVLEDSDIVHLAEVSSRYRDILLAAGWSREEALELVGMAQTALITGDQQLEPPDMKTVGGS